MSFTSELSTSRWTDVYVTAVARLLAGTGLFGATTALLLGLQSAGAGGLAAGALIAVSALPVVLLAHVAGRIVDRVDSRVLLVCAGLLESVSCVVLSRADSLWALYAGAVLLACAGTVIQPAFGALIPAMVRDEDLPRASAVGQTSSVIGMVSGPAVAGFCVGLVGTHTTLLLSGALALSTVAAGVLLRTRRGGRAAATEANGGAGAPASSWRLKDDAMVRITVIGLSTMVGLIAGINVVEVFFIRGTLGASETMYGMVTAAWPAGMLVGAWLLSARMNRIENGAALVQWVFLLGGGACLLVAASGALVHSAWWMVPLWAAGGACNGGLNVLMSVLMARRVRPEARGRAQAVIQGIVQGSSLAGYMAAGAVLELLDPRYIVITVGLFGTAGAVACFPFVRRSLRAAGEAAAEPAPVRREDGTEPVGA